MIIPIELKSGLIRRQSDRGVYIRNEQTGGVYTAADDLPNERRKKIGLEEYTYVETERVIEVESPEIDTETLAKAKAYDILVGGEE